MSSGRSTSSGLERSMAKLRARDPRALALLAAAAVAGATTAIAVLLWLRQGGGKPTTAGYGRGGRRTSTGNKVTPAPDGGKLDREEISKAFNDISALIESERLNADALERVNAQLLELENNMLASHEHVDELEGSFQAALDRHQQETAAFLAPLRQEVASLKHQLEILLFAANGRLSTGSAAGASSATAAPPSSSSSSSSSSTTTTTTNNNNDANASSNNNTKQRGRSSGAGLRDAGAALLGPGEEVVGEMQLRLQSHLATVALALGVASPSRKGSKGAASTLSAASPRDGNGFIISDWGDFH